MKLITWNVNGIRARHAQLTELMEREQPDVVCLQEIKASPGQVPEFPIHSALAGDYRTYWHGSGGYSGVALLVTMVGYAGWEPSKHYFNDLVIYTETLFVVVIMALASTRLSRGPSIAMTVVSVLVFDFCFVPPQFTFAISDSEYLITFAVMLGIGLGFLIARATRR